MSKPVTLPEPEYGWPTGVTQVTVRRLTPRGDTYAVDAVSLNGFEPYGPDVVGYLVGRADNWGGKRAWDYVVGTEEEAMSPDTQVHLVYPTTSRQTAAGALVEALARMEREQAAGDGR